MMTNALAYGSHSANTSRSASLAQLSYLLVLLHL